MLAAGASAAQQNQSASGFICTEPKTWVRLFKLRNGASLHDTHLAQTLVHCDERRKCRQTAQGLNQASYDATLHTETLLETSRTQG